MGQIPSWEANSCAVDKFPIYYDIRMLDHLALNGRVISERLTRKCRAQGPEIWWETLRKALKSSLKIAPFRTEVLT
jgi:hypothetical protein